MKEIMKRVMNNAKKVRFLKYASAGLAILALYIELQEFIFGLPSLFPVLLYNAVVFCVIWGLYQWQKERIHRAVKKLDEIHMLLPAGIIAVFIGILLFQSLISYITYMSAQTLSVLLFGAAFLFFRNRERMLTEVQNL